MFSFLWLKTFCALPHNVSAGRALALGNSYTVAEITKALRFHTLMAGLAAASHPRLTLHPGHG